MKRNITLRISFAVLALAMVAELLPSVGGRAASNLPPGGLDPTFDLDGKVTTQIGAGNAFAQAIAIQPDGKIVAAGLGRSETGSATTALARYNSDGMLDTTFGGDGTVTTPYGTHSRAFAVAVQADGKIVAGGDSGSPSAVFRYNSDGSLDSTFDGDGVLLIPFWGNDLIEAVAIQPDQKIVVAGWGEGPFFLKTDDDVRSSNLTPQNHTTDFALARLNPDGSLDASFGRGGKVLTNITGGEEAKALAIQPDGKILAAGWTANLFIDGGGLAVVRYDANGLLDNSFGQGGIVITDFGSESYGGAEAITLQPDGKIVAAGYYGTETTSGWAIARYMSDGSLDRSFDGDGRVTIPGAVTSGLNGVAIQSNGKIVTAGGNVATDAANDFFVLRLHANGAPDTSFDDDGMLTTDFSSDDDLAEAVAVQPNGAIVVAGLAKNGGTYNFAVARYIGDRVIPYRPPFDFDGDGRADISVFRPSEGVWYLQRSTAGFSATHFGLSTDKIVPADFDGDGKTDIGVYRDGVWYWLNSTGESNTTQFGVAGDIPVPGDYTGDGRAELTVYRSGTWYSLNLKNSEMRVTHFGVAGDKPVPADYDGDGKIDEAVYRNGEWHLNRSREGHGIIRFGLPGDLPVLGDYDGDGRADPAVYRNGTWYLLQSTEGFAAFQFGLSTDVPAPADFDGDGRTDATVYRGGTWWTIQSATGQIGLFHFGLSDDSPVPSAFVPR